MITLENFPEEFQPLVIVTGDRREDRPKTKGDLLAYSVSNIDLTYLLYLGLKDVQIFSDKIFELEDKSRLVDKFGNSHILTIGSPAGNLFTRIINDSNLFFFDIPKAAKDDIALHHKVIDDIKFSPVELQVYQEIFKNNRKPEDIIKLDFVDYSDKEHIANICQGLYNKYCELNLSEQNWKQFMHNLDRPGINDLLDGRKHGVVTKGFNDFGLISLAINPFSHNKSHLVITIAGIHGIATAHGVKLLARKDSFTNRPYGGVFEVKFPEYRFFSDKLEQAQLKWETKPYNPLEKPFSSIQQIKQLNHFRPSNYNKISIFVSSPYNEDDKNFSFLNAKIKTLFSSLPQTAETAYSISTGGRGTFPNVIGDTIHTSISVVHILNQFKAGVLCEVGLSIGYKKRAFLVWDDHFGKFEIAELPSLLKKMSIIRFDSSKKAKFERIFRNRIIDPCLEMKGDLLCPQHESKECDFVIDEMSNTAFIYASPTLSSFLGRMMEIAKDEFHYHIFDKSDIRANGELCTACCGITGAKTCIFLLDLNDKNGDILVGISSSKQKKSLLLREEEISMYGGDFNEITNATLSQDIEKALRIFLRKVNT